MRSSSSPVDVPRQRRLLHGSAALAFALAALAACETAPAPPDRACRLTSALGVEELRGASLPPKTISLTFDDGPGARTLELSAWLAARGIRAAFFVNGQMLGAGGAETLTKLVANGHIVANHTQTHRSLTGRMTGAPRLPPAEISWELEQTDLLLAPYAGARLLFRAPFGDYDAETAAVLQASPMGKYVGPVGWDIGDHMGPAQAADWDCWVPGSDGTVLTPAECGARYVAEIEAVGRGIVLLHDPYFPGDDPARGGTVEMVKEIVPVLLAKGYAFARVDEVPAIAALLPASVAAPGADASAPRDAAPDATVSPEDASAPRHDASRGAPAEGGSAPSPADPCAR